MSFKFKIHSLYKYKENKLALNKEIFLQISFEKDSFLSRIVTKKMSAPACVGADICKLSFIVIQRSVALPLRRGLGGCFIGLVAYIYASGAMQN